MNLTAASQKSITTLTKLRDAYGLGWEPELLFEVNCCIADATYALEARPVVISVRAATLIADLIPTSGDVLTEEALRASIEFIAATLKARKGDDGNNVVDFTIGRSRV